MSNDMNGQPTNLGFNRARRMERDISEMLGLVKGILADGKVTDEEIALLNTWVSTKADIIDQWPICVVHRRLEKILEDGIVEDEERKDLSQLLNSLVGGEAGIIGGEGTSTALPIDTPAPQIEFEGRTFVFTGKFLFGPRKACEKTVDTLGGRCEGKVTRRTNFLVIGLFGSRDWIHTSFGRKIEKAVAYRESGLSLAIVSEDHWAEQLGTVA